MITYPGDDLIANPRIALTYTIQLSAKPPQVWPWIIQMGYHRGGWYIDTWWDRFAQAHVWPRLVPKEARGTYLPPAEHILPEFQSLEVGDIIPDGPPGTAFYEIAGLKKHSFLLLYSTSHFKYMVPPFLAGSRLEPQGEFSWAFVLEALPGNQTRIVSRWRGTAGPLWVILPWLPVVRLADHFHQKEILKGLKLRVEKERGGRH